MKKRSIRFACLVTFTSACLFILTGQPGPTVGGTVGSTPFYHAELIFPLEHWHNHASSIVEAPNGDLLVCWYHGSGERTADDVKIEGARKKKGASN